MTKETVFIYRADIYCNSCGMATIRDLVNQGGKYYEYEEYRLAEDESAYDSDNYPKGPFPIDESDTPQHCAGCDKFLANELTNEGAEYVRDIIWDAMHDPETPNNATVLFEWSNHYRWDNRLEDICNEYLEFIQFK